MDMKKEIEEFKKNNGNDNFSTRELQMYMIQRQDKDREEQQEFNKFVRDKFEKGTGKIGDNTTGVAKNKVKISGLKNFIKYSCIIGIPTTLGFVGWLVYELFKHSH